MVRQFLGHSTRIYEDIHTYKHTHIHIFIIKLFSISTCVDTHIYTHTHIHTYIHTYTTTTTTIDVVTWHITITITWYGKVTGIQGHQYRHTSLSLSRTHTHVAWAAISHQGKVGYNHQLRLQGGDEFGIPAGEDEPIIPLTVLKQPFGWRCHTTTTITQMWDKSFQPCIYV